MHRTSEIKDKNCKAIFRRKRFIVLEEFGKPLVVQEVELAEPGPREVLVRLVACGVCHTDLYTASGADPSGYAPAVLGHEGAGVVEEVGSGVTDHRVGDRAPEIAHQAVCHMIVLKGAVQAELHQHPSRLG